MSTEPMNEGVLLLAKRMEENPGEFVEGSPSKWARIMTSFPERYRTVLTSDEINYLMERLRKAQRDNFTAQVLRALTDTETVQERLESKLGIGSGYLSVTASSNTQLLTSAGQNGTRGNKAIGGMI